LKFKCIGTSYPNFNRRARCAYLIMVQQIKQPMIALLATLFFANALWANNGDLNGTWLPQTLLGDSLDKKTTPPDLTLHTAKMLVSGFNGCNQYNGKITALTDSTIEFKNLATTRRVCPDMRLSERFDKVLSSTAKYTLQGSDLTLYNEKGNVVATFSKKPASEPNRNLNDIWFVRSINGTKLARSVAAPRLEIIADKKALGSDGCNDFVGKISDLTGTEIKFAPMMSTMKTCVGDNVAELFNKAISTTETYVLDGTTLTFYNQAGKDVLVFVKGD
jgi:heat shock protein HslJ